MTTDENLKRRKYHVIYLENSFIPCQGIMAKLKLAERMASVSVAVTQRLLQLPYKNEWLKD